MTYIIGLDAGGTYTDTAIIDSTSKKILASGKSLTTNPNLILGLSNSLSLALKQFPNNKLKDIKLVVLSSTLATNSVVNSQGNSVGLIIIGFDKGFTNQINLNNHLSKFELFHVNGGHYADGSEEKTLDTNKIKLNVIKKFENLSSVAITGKFSVRNPDHELKAKKILRSLLPLPVTCSHELTSNLNAQKRAITCVLNASLTSIINNLINDVEKMIGHFNLNAKLMVVKGDGSIINANTARSKPIETIMSGPAASSIGASWLSKEKNGFVVDIGGTTTDISIIKSGAPTITRQGAKIGKFQTMIESIDVQTIGLGGDSEVKIDEKDEKFKISLGPKRVIPLSILADLNPQIIKILNEQNNFPIASISDGKFAWLKNSISPPSWLTKIELNVLQKLNEFDPLPVSDIAPNQSSLGALYRLLNYNLVNISSFTPTDALHVISNFKDYNKKAAILGAKLISKTKTKYGKSITSSHLSFSDLVIEKLIYESAKAVFDYSLNLELSKLTKNNIDENPVLKHFFYENAGETSNIIFKMKLPIIAIGAPAKSYYPKIASKLSTKLFIPKNSSIAGSIGAAIGSVIQSTKILITQIQQDCFRVHDYHHQQNFKAIKLAKQFAIKKALKYSREKCKHSGAIHIKSTYKVIDKVVYLDKNKKVFLESEVIATSVGDPIR